MSEYSIRAVLRAWSTWTMYKHTSCSIGDFDDSGSFDSDDEGADPTAESKPRQRPDLPALQVTSISNCCDEWPWVQISGYEKESTILLLNTNFHLQSTRPCSYPRRKPRLQSTEFGELRMYSITAHLHTITHTHPYIHTHLHLYIHIYIQMHIYMHIQIHVDAHMQLEYKQYAGIDTIHEKIKS